MSTFPPTPLPDHDVLTAAEVAAYLRLSEDSVYRAGKVGQLPCVRIGRRVVFRRDAILALTRGETPTVEARLLAVSDGKAGSAGHCEAEAQRLESVG